VIVEGVIRVV
jgi:hypothetical protein